MKRFGFALLLATAVIYRWDIAEPVAHQAFNLAVANPGWMGLGLIVAGFLRRNLTWSAAPMYAATRAIFRRSKRDDLAAYVAALATIPVAIIETPLAFTLEALLGLLPAWQEDVEGQACLMKTQQDLNATFVELKAIQQQVQQLHDDVIHLRNLERMEDEVQEHRRRLIRLETSTSKIQTVSGGCVDLPTYLQRLDHRMQQFVGQEMEISRTDIASCRHEVARLERILIGLGLTAEDVEAEEPVGLLELIKRCGAMAVASPVNRDGEAMNWWHRTENGFEPAKGTPPHKSCEISEFFMKCFGGRDYEIDFAEGKIEVPGLTDAEADRIRNGLLAGGYKWDSRIGDVIRFTG